MILRVVYFLVFVICWTFAQEASGNDISWSGDPCSVDGNSSASVACQGLGIVKRVVAQLLDERKGTVKLADGVELVKVANLDKWKEYRGEVENEQEGRSVRGLWKGFQRFLMEHELRVKLPELLPSMEDLGLAGTSDQLKETSRGIGGGSKGGGGGGGLLAMAVMMKGMMAAIGMGGLGLLAMKALMVSAMALMLSAVVGIKKLSSKDDGGGHYVVHAGGGDHHRKRRQDEAMTFAYRAYAPKGL